MLMIVEGEIKLTSSIYPRSLKHPNIISLLGYCITRQEAILVTNLVNGSNLDKILFSKHLHDQVRVKTTKNLSGFITHAVNRSCGYFNSSEDSKWY